LWIDLRQHDSAGGQAHDALSATWGAPIVQRPAPLHMRARALRIGGMIAADPVPEIQADPTNKTHNVELNRVVPG